jgi:hypothetical protein
MLHPMISFSEPGKVKVRPLSIWYNPTDQSQPENMPGYYDAMDDYSQTVDPPEAGADYAYDSVISIGIGTCLAESDGEMDGHSHLQGIKSSNFVGASGKFSYCEGLASVGTRT